MARGMSLCPFDVDMGEVQQELIGIWQTASPAPKPCLCPCGRCVLHLLSHGLELSWLVTRADYDVGMLAALQFITLQNNAHAYFTFEYLFICIGDAVAINIVAGAGIMRLVFHALSAYHPCAQAFPNSVLSLPCCPEA
jgi:hypothetical protein